MTPNEVKAITIIREHLNLGTGAFNPVEVKKDAEWLSEQMGFEVRESDLGGGTLVEVLKDRKVIYRMSGGDVVNKAIVNAAADYIRPGWRE